MYCHICGMVLIKHKLILIVELSLTILFNINHVECVVKTGETVNLNLLTARK